MEYLRKLRWVLYPSVFLLMLFVGSYCSFPKDVLQEMVESSVTKAALDLNPTARVTPKVVIKDVSLWRLIGVSMDEVKLAWPASKGGLPITIDFDRLRAKVGLFSLLTGKHSILAESKLYEGEFESQVKINKQKELRSLYIRADKINLGKMSFIESVAGSPLAGILNASVQLDASTALLADGAGSIDFALKQGILGPGTLKMPSGGFMPEITIPKVNLGDFVANLALENGQVNSKKFEFTGGDLQGELTLNIALAKPFSNSKVTGNGWFSLKKEFINGNETIKMLFDLVPELKEASMGNGRVPISLRGTVRSLKFSLGTGGLSDNKAPKNTGQLDG